MVSAFRPPLEDIKFCLREIADLPVVLELQPYQDFSEDLLFTILEEAGKFATSVLSPLNLIGDREACQIHAKGQVSMPKGFADAYRAFVQNGWNAAPISAEISGQGLPSAVATALSEMWHGANMAFGLCPMLTQSAIELITRHGSAALQKTFLPKLVSGEWTGTMCMTEPQAGSDVGAVRTRAIPAKSKDALGQHYHLTGTKIFITYGDHDLSTNIIHMVLARLPDAPTGTKGLSLFLVPKFLVAEDGTIGERNDVTCVSLEHKMGIKASPTAVMAFGEKQGAIGYLIGTPHQGIQAMFTMMNAARLAVGLEGIGIAGYASQLADEYAKQRIQGLNPTTGKPATIAEHGDVARMLLTLRAHSESMRGLAYLAGSLMDKARNHPEEKQLAQAELDLLIPIIKAHGSEIGFEMASLAMQVFGGIGYIEETGISQLVRDARVAMIYEGTNGIQALDLVNRKIHLEEGKAFEQFMRSVEKAAQQWHGNKTEKNYLFEASQHCRMIFQWLRGLYKTTPERTFPPTAQWAASSFLRMMGLTAQAYIMTQSAIAAANILKEQKTVYDGSFLQDKIKTAEFFLTFLLPEVSSLAQRIRNIAGQKK